MHKLFPRAIVGDPLPKGFKISTVESGHNFVAHAGNKRYKLKVEGLTHQLLGINANRLRAAIKTHVKTQHNDDRVTYIGQPKKTISEASGASVAKVRTARARAARIMKITRAIFYKSMGKPEEAGFSTAAKDSQRGGEDRRGRKKKTKGS